MHRTKPGKGKKKTYLTREVADPITSGILTIELCDKSNDFSMGSLSIECKKLIHQEKEEKTNSNRINN